MGLFTKKKDEKNECGCECGCTGSDVKSDVKILGSGCAKCNALEAATKEALRELGRSDAVEHVTDFSEIAKYGVMSTPALVAGGKVLSSGKVLKKDEVKKLLENA